MEHRQRECAQITWTNLIRSCGGSRTADLRGIRVDSADGGAIQNEITWQTLHGKMWKMWKTWLAGEGGRPGHTVMVHLEVHGKDCEDVSNDSW